MVLVLTQCQNFKVTLFRVPAGGKCENTVTFWMWPVIHFIHLGFAFGGQDCSVLQESLLPSFFQRLDVGLPWSA